MVYFLKMYFWKVYFPKKKILTENFTDLTLAIEDTDDNDDHDDHDDHDDYDKK